MLGAPLRSTDFLYCNLYCKCLPGDSALSVGPSTQIHPDRLGGRQINQGRSPVPASSY
jgi:hypothetical protein